MAGHLLYNDMHANPPLVASAAGVWLTDTSGKRYLDGSSGAVVSAIGHSHPHVTQAIKRQAERVTFAHRGSFTSEALVNLADRLCSFAGYEAAWFVGSGSEATEAALQLAVQYHRERGNPERTWFLSFERGYHGNTLGALSLSGNTRRGAVSSLVHDFPALPAPYAYREQGERTEDEWVSDMLASARGLLRERAGSLAGVVVELVGGATMGATVAPARYISGLRELCTELGVLFIADEVMTGMGRCGMPMASQRYGVEPDLAIMGKGLGAGYTPIAAALVSDHVRQTLLEGSARILGGHTYAGNPLSAATALAVLEVFEREGVIDNGVRMGERLARGLREIQQQSPIVGDARGAGMLHALELVTDKGSRALPQPQGSLAQTLYRNAKEIGLMVYPTTGGVNDAVVIAPPLTITSDEIDLLLERLAAATAATANGRLGTAAAANGGVGTAATAEGGAAGA